MDLDLGPLDDYSGVVLIREGEHEVVARACGLASRTWSVPMTLDMRFDVASVTKLFTTVATLQLIEQGAFALDTPVVEYVGLAGTTIPNAVTPYHCLTHTSGIADDADEEDGERYEDLFVDSPNYRVRNTADALPYFAQKPPRFAPGDGCRYCNAGFVLLGLMIERATGGTYRDYVTEHVFARAGMARSGFFSMDVVTPDIAEPVELADESWRRNIYSYPPVGGPDGGAHSTAYDLVRFRDAMAGGALLGPELTAAMLEPKVLHSANHFMGFGLEFDKDDAGAIRSYWKEGVNVGTSAFLAHYPGPGITVVVLSVGEDAAWPVVRAIDAAAGSSTRG